MIKDPKIIKLKCSTVAALIGIPSIKGKLVIKMGTRTINAAPMKAPDTLPNPPMMIINKISKDMFISNTSTSADPK